MKKIEIFVGSDSAFEKIVPKSARNLSEMAAKLDDGNKKMDVFVNIPGQPEPKLKKKKKPRVQDFVIHADEYCSVQEHVIINFINFIFQMSITNMYIQNPPKIFGSRYIEHLIKVLFMKHNSHIWKFQRK